MPVYPVGLAEARWEQGRSQYLVLVVYTVVCAGFVARAIAGGDEYVHVIGFPGCYDSAYSIRLMLA